MQPFNIRARTDDGKWIPQFTIEEIQTFHPAPDTFEVPKNSFLQIDATPDDNALD